MKSKLSCYQLKIDCYIYTMFQASLKVTTTQKPIEDTHKIKRRDSKYTTMEKDQFTKEDNKRETKEQSNYITA